MSILERFAAALKLSQEEKNFMFDLAGKDRETVPLDLPEYILSNQIIRDTLRLAREVATEDDWMRFNDFLEKKKGLSFEDQ